VDLKGDVQRLQHIGRLFDDGQIAVAAHDDTDFFAHENLLKIK
jgi:hypothetical protein